MNAETALAELKLSDIDARSDLARTLERLVCQMNHPSMRGRVLNLPALLSREPGDSDRVPGIAG